MIVATPPPPLALERIVQMADARWGSPCGGRVALSFVRGLPNHGGYAYANECRVEVDRDLLGHKISLCMVISHEYGHLAGRSHSDDPRSIMYPDLSKRRVIYSAPECIPHRLRSFYADMARGIIR